LTDDRHPENGFIARYISSDFNEIWRADANFDFKNGRVTKNQHFANSK